MARVISEKSTLWTWDAAVKQTTSLCLTRAISKGHVHSPEIIAVKLSFCRLQPSCFTFVTEKLVVIQSVRVLKSSVSGLSLSFGLL